MIRLRRIFLVIALFAATVVLYQFFFYFARRPLNDALIEAVKKDDLEQVDSLLVRGADVNSRDGTRFLSCTDGNPPRTRRTPLIVSLFQFSRDLQIKRDTGMLDLLLKHGANPNIGDAYGMTPLYFASSQGNLPAVQDLLSHGADANATDYDGDTPLTEAAYRDNIEVVKLLLTHGADVNAKDHLGFSALARTTGYRNNIKIMILLLAHGADVNTRNKFGATPLHKAAEYGRIEAMRLLLQNGAEPNAKDAGGQTPLSMARGYGLKSMDKEQDNNQQDKIAQRRALMTKILTNSVTSN